MIDHQNKNHPKLFTMLKLAEAIGGKLVGNGDYTIERLVHPADVQGPHDLALAMEANLLPLLVESGARAAVVTDESAIDDIKLEAYIVIKRARLAMAKLTNLFSEKVKIDSGIHPTAIIEKGAKIGENCSIGAMSYICAGADIGANSILHPQVYVGRDAKIGEDTLIYPGVKIGARVHIGARCIIHFNASIGADGFSFVTPDAGSVETVKTTGEVKAINKELVRIASLGAVEIGEDVEIGANTSIDRGTIKSTLIGRGTKIDNQVQIGHNVIIGKDCLICGRVGIAGSAVIGDRVVLGGAVGVADHVKIGDDVVAMAMSGIAGNIPPKSVVGGIPAKPRARAVEEHLLIGRLKLLVNKVESLVERVSALERRTGVG